MDGQQAHVLNRDLSVSVVDTRQGKISHTLNAPFASAMAQKRWQAIGGTWQLWLATSTQYFIGLAALLTVTTPALRR